MKKLHELISEAEEWKHHYHVNKSGEIIFQNKKTLTNVRFHLTALQEIKKHSRGFELVPTAIQQPDEIWARWENEKSQRVVLRNYILNRPDFCYIVQTKDGLIQDALIVSKSMSLKYKKGLPL